MGQKLKKQRWVEVSQLFLPETVALDTIQDWLRKVKLPRRWVLLLNENEWHNSTETANHDINWPMSTQLENTISFLVAKLHINIIMDDNKITIILFLFKNEQYFYI